MHLSNQIEENRKQVSQIIYAVISHEIIAREGLKKFPKDSDDESLKVAWHAIIHYDADEDMRANDPEYATEQHEYLAFLAETLAKGEEVPANIRDEYREYYDEIKLPTSEKSIKRFFRFIT